MYSAGFFILDKKVIEKNISQNNLFQSLESKINFVNFLKVIHDSIMSSNDIDKNTYIISGVINAPTEINKSFVS